MSELSEDYVSPILILDSIIRRIDQLEIKSWNKSNSPHEQRNRVPHKAEHWVAYEGSRRGEEIDETFDAYFNAKSSITRVMSFSTFVKVNDLRKDYTSALVHNEEIIKCLNGFIPDIPFSGVKEPLKFVNDTLLSPNPRDPETTHKYQNNFTLVTELGRYANDFDPLYLTEIKLNVWKSDIGFVGDYEHSVLDSKIVITQDNS